MNTLKTSQKNNSHTQDMRNAYGLNRRMIQSLGISSENYNNRFLECGCLFLENIYDRNDKVGEVWYNNFSKKQRFGFWKWFDAQFKIHQNDFIEANPAIGIKEWNKFLKHLPNSKILEESFFMMLKSKTGMYV